MIGKATALMMLALVCAAALAQAKPANSEATAQEIWRLEHSYWDYVKAFDAEHYKALWSPDYVGWPATSEAPIGPEHITDWFADFQKKGSHLEYAKIRPAGIQTFGNVVVVHYWLTELWLDKDGKGLPQTFKMTHTWMRTADAWKIIGGMSAHAPNPGRASFQ